MPDLYSLGEIVDLNGQLCVVVGLPGQLLNGSPVPADHLAVWFGGEEAKVKLESRARPTRPEVWTIPKDYFGEALEPEVKH